MAKFKIKIMSYNIYHWNNFYGEDNFESLANLIIKESPDFIAFQEVEINSLYSQNKDKIMELSKMVNYNGYFAKTLNYSDHDGEYGNSVLTKMYPKKYEVISLPNFNQTEPRNMIHFETNILNKIDISFFATHLDADENDSTLRKKQLSFISEILRKIDHPYILLGDLNSDFDSVEIKQLLKSGLNIKTINNGMTWPINNPKWKLDYIMGSPRMGIEIVSQKLISDSISDHLGIICEVEINYNNGEYYIVDTINK